MNKPLFEVADILHKGFGQYQQTFGPLSPDHYKVANALMACRTSILGGHRPMRSLQPRAHFL